MGNAAFVDRLSSSGKVNVLRIVNAGDMVTKVLGVAPRLPHKKEQYQHVGAELRIDSKNSPCLRPDAGARLLARPGGVPAPHRRVHGDGAALPP